MCQFIFSKDYVSMYGLGTKSTTADSEGQEDIVLPVNTN